MSTQKFVVSHLDEQLGPFDENELKAKWSAGEILPIDYVYDEGKQDWVLLTERFPWAAKPSSVAHPAPTPKVEEHELQMEETAKIDLSKASEFAEVTGSFSFDSVAPTMVAESLSPAADLPQAPPTAPKTATPPEASTQLQLVNGVGEVDLASLKPGHLELSVRDSQSGRIRNANPHAITVKAAEPSEVLWHWPEQITVGQTVEVQFRAVDAAGAVCLGYDEALTLEVRGDEHADHLIEFKDGQARHVFKHTKAGQWHVALNYGGKKRLELPQKRALEWQPGPAAKLVIDGPHEYTAGQSLKVQVRAVDEFGNVAKHFQGTVALEVKAS